MKNSKKKKYSSFPKDQLLVENFRGFIERAHLEEEIDRIIGQTERQLLSEGKLEEGLMQQVFKIGKKLGLDKLALIAAITYGANSPVAKNFVEDLEAQVGDKYSDIQQAAETMASNLEAKGIKLTKSPEGDPVFDHGESSPEEAAEEITAALERDHFDKNLKKMADNVYRGDNKGFIFGTKVNDVNLDYNERAAAQDKIEKLAAENGAEVNARTMTLTQLDDGYYVTMSTRYAN